MNTQAKVDMVLEKVKPGIDLKKETRIIEDGYLDSFELMFLITELNSEFDIEISINEMVPENFNSIEAIASMVEKLRG